MWCEMSGVWSEMKIVRNQLAGHRPAEKKMRCANDCGQYNISLCDMPVTDKLARHFISFTNKLIAQVPLTS